MANIAVFSSVINGGSTIVATGIADNSSANYIADDLLSYKFISSGSAVKISVDQPDSNVQTWRYLHFVDHNLNGSLITVSGYNSVARTSPALVVQGSATSTDPFQLDSGSNQSYQFFDIFISGIATTASIGEIIVGPKFTSPQRPGIGIQTDRIPRRTTVEMPNGERQSIRHAGVVREKTYTIPGLTVSGSDAWSDLFVDNEGVSLVILEDDVGDTYPCYMQQTLTTNNEVNIFSLELIFTEINLD